MQLYCPVCDCKRDIKVVTKEETYQVKGEPVTIMSNVCTCAVCGEEILSFEYDNENMLRAYAIYDARHHSHP